VVVAAWYDHMHSRWFLAVEGILTALFLAEVLLRVRSAQGLRPYMRQGKLNVIDFVLAVVCAVLFVFNVVVGGSSSAEAEVALIGVRYTRYARYISQIGRICLFGLLLASSSQKLTEYSQGASEIIVEAPGGARSLSPPVSPSHRLWMHDDLESTPRRGLLDGNSPPLVPLGNMGAGWTLDSGGGGSGGSAGGDAPRKRNSPACHHALRPPPAAV